MDICLPDRRVSLFTVMYRSEDTQVYKYSDLQDIVKLSDEFGYTGILLFESNRGNIEPWVFAQLVMSEARCLCPFIAINPIYMHPFTAAKKILSLSSLYERKIYINFISGTSKNDMTNLGDEASREMRYDRLGEYIEIVDRLLHKKGVLNFSGNHYRVRNLLLSGTLPEKLLPEYFIAGASEEARKLHARFTSTAFHMAQEEDCRSRPENIVAPQKKAVHFGLITRPGEEQARKLLGELFESKDGKELLEYSMGNTESVWKKELFNKSDEGGTGSYSLYPFKNFKADCPYYVGDYEQIATVIETYILNGISSIVIEVPGSREDFMHIQNALQLAKEKLLMKSEII